MSTNADLKRLVAQEALSYIKPGTILGVGSGSTVNIFIQKLHQVKSKIKCTTSSSEATTQALLQEGFEVCQLSECDRVDLYIDGADEFDTEKCLIKGGGGALTREKIIAQAAKQFICIVDESKRVNHLGKFPLPIEVIPMARSQIAFTLMKLFPSAEPVYRDDVVTDNGNQKLDIYNLDIPTPVETERMLNNIVGTVTNGLFALRKPDVILMSQSTSTDIKIIT